MKIKEVYDEIGGNYNEALSRLMKDSLIERFVLKFLNDKSFEKLSYSIGNKDWEESFKAAHSLKGVSLNLAFSVLGAASSVLTEKLRDYKNADEREIKELFEAVSCRYAEAAAAIEKFKASLG